MANRKALSLIIGLTMILTLAGMRAKTLIDYERTIAPVVVKSLDDKEAMEEVATIYFQETLTGTGDAQLAFQVAATALGVIETHFYSGSSNALIVHFPPVPPPVQQLTQQNSTTSGSNIALSSEAADINGSKEGSQEAALSKVSELSKTDDSEQCTMPSGGTDGGNGGGITIDETLDRYFPDTGTTTSGGTFDLGLNITGDWAKTFTPNDWWDPGSGGYTTLGVFPDAVDCLDLGGEFGLFYDAYDYGDGGPGESSLTIGWTWSL